MLIYLIEPFFSGSHKQWALGLRDNSSHKVMIFSLPGRHWKWRMHGAAVSLAKQIEGLPSPDLFLVSDMLDLSTFIALLRPGPSIPFVLYFHENQLTYPWSKSDVDTKLKRDLHYSWINYTSALCADKIFFNSNYHFNSFQKALPNFLNNFPDNQNKEGIYKINEKSAVLPLAMNLISPTREKIENKTKTILWNHRWEYDKNPEGFFELLFNIEKIGLEYRLIILGEKNKKYPAIFDKATDVLAHRIDHIGYVESKEKYFELLMASDILPVTANQDFFGGSVVEAISAGVIPLVPNRLAYAEHIPPDLHHLLIFNSEKELFHVLKDLLSDPLDISWQQSLINYVQKYSWFNLAKKYDDELSKAQLQF